MGNQNSSETSVVTSGLTGPSPSTQILEDSNDTEDRLSSLGSVTNSDLTDETTEAENGRESEENPSDTADLVGILFREEDDCTAENNVDDSGELEPGPIDEGKDEGQIEANSFQEDAINPPIEDRVNARKKVSVTFWNPREIQYGKVIGEGGFGRILQGGLQGIKVVIKFFHAPLSSKASQAEVDALMTLKHRSIIQVYGIVEQFDPMDCPQVILQYFPEGNVLQYLSRKENPEDKGTLGKFALDVIEGCQYLQHKKIVHGNLAARNVLIDKIVGKTKTYYNAKVSDMGIIRFAEATGANFVKVPGSERVVPLRWVPKEIIDVDGPGTAYTFASDMWSFGVLLWEFWTRGAIPYGASYSNMRVIQFLKDGYSPLKVHRPTDCPKQVASVMESIFRVEPSERPTFDDLYREFESFKGFGRDNKPPVKGKTSFQAPSMNGGNNGAGVPSEVGAGAVTPATSNFNRNQEEELKEKAERKKKKKNKIKEKMAGPPPYTGTGGHDPSYERPGYFNSTESGRNTVSRAESFSSYPGRNRQSGDGSNYPGSEQFSDEATVAALLLRVNQLERERHERSRGRGRGARRAAMWGQRTAPPRFNDGYYNNNSPHSPILSPDSGNNGPPIGQNASSQIPTPAPPPYTEDPLPHHSSSRFVSTPMTPEYEYGAHATGPSHGRVSRAGSGGRGIAPSSSSSRRSEYLHKVRQLAEEIEFLRAEKMTQELLKKSAELATLMKQMTLEAREESEPSYLPNETSSYRGRSYEEYGYRYSQQGQHSGWQQESPDYNQEEGYSVPQSHQNFQNRSVHQYQQQPSSRRPYLGKNPGRGRGFGKRGGGNGGGAAGRSMDYAGSGQ